MSNKESYKHSVEKLEIIRHEVENMSQGSLLALQGLLRSASCFIRFIVLCDSDIVHNIA